MEIQVFQNEEFGEVRTHIKNGEPWFVAMDVCKCLGLKNIRQSVVKLDDDERDGVCLSDTIGREQSVSIVSESGLYTLIMRSKKPQAKAFRKWVTSVVLPSIRKTGQYIHPGLPNCVDLGKYLLSSENMPIETFVKIFAVKDLVVDKLKLLKWFHWRGYLIAEYGENRNKPTIKCAEAGLMTSEVRQYRGKDGVERDYNKVFITPRGQDYFLNIFFNTNVEQIVYL